MTICKCLPAENVLCNGLETNDISACSTDKITIHNTLDMSNNEIVNQRIDGIEFRNGSPEATSIFFTYDSGSNSYQNYILGTSNRVVFIKFLPTNVTSYGWTPTYTSDVSNSTRLVIPFTGIYSLSFNWGLLDMLNDNVSCIGFISKNAGTSTFSNIVDLNPPQNLGSEMTTPSYGGFLTAGMISLTTKLNQGDYINIGLIFTGVKGSGLQNQNTKFNIYLLQRL